MKRKRSDEGLQSAMDAAVDGQDRAALLAALRQALDRGSFEVVMHAADIAGKQELDGAVPALEAAMARLLLLPAARDPGCLAKLAVANAMRTIGGADAGVLLQGARHVQMEAVWGGSVDTAGNLRGVCVTTLVEESHPGAMYEAVRLLADPMPEARRHAVQAVAAAGRVESELLLRMKALHGDPDDTIVADAIAALMRIDPERSVDFAAGFLNSPSAAIREETALALGESHLPAAFAHLRTAWETPSRLEAPSKLLLAMALHRSDEAFEFLAGIVGSDTHARACEVLGALAIFRQDSARWKKVEDAVARRHDARLSARLREMA